MTFVFLLLVLSATASFGQNFQWSFNGPTTQSDPSPPYVSVNAKGKRGPNPLMDWQRHQSFDVLHYDSDPAEAVPYFNDVNNVKVKSSLNQRDDPRDKEVEFRNRFRSQTDNARFLNSAFFSLFFSTTTFTVSVSVTSAVVSSCIPATQFITSSTNPCARRRRRGIEYEESFADPLPLDITPSQVETLAASVQPLLGTVNISQPEIMSSQDHVVDEISRNELAPSVRRARQIRFTTTTTSYFFTSTVVKKTVNLITGSMQLNCLPSPYIIC